MILAVVLKVGGQDLEGHGAAVTCIVGLVDHGHATPADLCPDLVGAKVLAFTQRLWLHRVLLSLLAL